MPSIIVPIQIPSLMQRMLTEHATAVKYLLYRAHGLSTLTLFDMDCNLTHPELKQHAQTAIEESQSLGIQQMLVPGASLDESDMAIALCQEHPTVLFPTAGVHPYHVNEELCNESSVERLRRLINVSQGIFLRQWLYFSCSNDVKLVKAVGECGLDYSEGFPPPQEQLEWFKCQLKLAEEVQKPLFLHERLAFDTFYPLIQQFRQDNPNIRLLVHCFTGTSEELQAYIDLGCWIGITGFIFKAKIGRELQKMIPRIPLNRLVIETDAPYMGFNNCRRDSTLFQHISSKKHYPNVPTSLIQIATAVSDLLGQPVEEVSQQSTENARTFLGLS